MRFHRSTNDPSYWRARANELRAVAAQATDAKVKATTFGAADGYDKLAQLEKASPASELPDAAPQPVDVEKERALQSGLSSVREFRVADAPNSLGDCKGIDQLRLATTAGPAMADDGGHERLGTSIYGLQDQHQVCRLPRATQLQPIHGLPPVNAHKAVPTRVSIDPYQRMPTPTLGRPGRTFLGGTRFLVAGAMIAAGAGCFVVAIWPPEMDFADAPTPMPSEARLVTPSPLAQTVLPPMQLKGHTSESESLAQKPKLTMSSEDKLTESGNEGRSPQALPATEYRTTGDTSAMSGSSSVHQTSPNSSADAALKLLDSAPPIERERRFAARVHVSTCFPSASDVRQDNPTAWPSWTLRAPGHEGTKCWYAGTRAAAVTAFVAPANEKPVRLKQAPGLDKVEAHCGACHSLDYVLMNSPFLSAAGWDAEVAKMINAFGAPIDQADAKTIADYLAKNYGNESLLARPAGPSSPEKDKSVGEPFSSNFEIAHEKYDTKRPRTLQMVAIPRTSNHPAFKRTSLENRDSSVCSAFQSCSGYVPLLLGVGP
jgi:hypothetical protein